MQRYMNDSFGMFGVPDGEWVRHEDAEAELARLRAEMESRNDAYNRLEVAIDESERARERLNAEVEKLRVELAAYESTAKVAGKLLHDGLQKEALLNREVRELRRDRARLDWVEQQKPNVFRSASRDGEDWVVSWHSQDGLEIASAKRMRGAIDAAMDGGEGEA